MELDQPKKHRPIDAIRNRHFFRTPPAGKRPAATFERQAEFARVFHRLFLALCGESATLYGRSHGEMAEFDRSVMLRIEMQRTRTESFKRFHRLGQERQRLLVRAALILSAASGTVALLPFERAIRFGSVPLGYDRKRLRGQECVWAVEAAAWRLPWRTMCIEKGIAVQRLLRRSGTDARLHYGARHHPETGKLEAHVWVTIDGQIVIGGEEAAGFAEVGVFPS